MTDKTQEINFETVTDQIIGHVFGKDKILKNISNMRKIENSHENNMKV